MESNYLSHPCMYKQSLIKAHFSLNEIQLNFFPTWYVKDRSTKLEWKN